MVSNAALWSNNEKTAQKPVSRQRRMSFETFKRVDSALYFSLKPEKAIKKNRLVRYEYNYVPYRKHIYIFTEARGKLQLERCIFTTITKIECWWNWLRFHFFLYIFFLRKSRSNFYQGLDSNK